MAGADGALGLALLYAAAAGLMMPLGALLARVEHIRPDWLETELRHSVMAFGGGVLMAAVSFVLVPEGASRLGPGAAVAAFVAGGIAFALLMRRLARSGGTGAQVLAMLADFVPEAAALGAMLATGSPVAGLLAFLIGLQNLPEGFNAYREVTAAGMRAGRALALFLALAALGPMAAAVGVVFFVDLPGLLGAVMLFAAGGIFFLTFDAIAVEAHLEARQAPSLAAVGGFAFGLFGHLLTG